MAISARVNEAIVDYLDKTIMDGLLKTNPGWALVSKKGGSKKNLGSDTYAWDLNDQSMTARSYGDGEQLTFGRDREVIKIRIPYRQRIVTQLLTKTEKEQAHGAFAVDVVNGLAKRLKDALISDLSAQLYANGGTATNLHGLETMFAGTSATAGVRRVTSGIGSYGGISLAVDAVTSDTARRDYASRTPYIVDATSTAFGGSADTWAAQGDEALRYAGIGLQNKFGGSKRDFVWLMNGEDYSVFLEKLEALHRLVFMANKDDVDLNSTGFGEHIRYDGMKILYDDYCPASKAYALNFRNAAIVCPGKSMIDVATQDDIDVVGTKFLARFHGTFCWSNPATFGQVLTA